MDQQNHNEQREWKAKDFERYYKNNMPPEERHALEKAALEDPFLQDALEGYEYTHTPVEDVQLLKNKLRPGRDKASVLWYQQPAISRVLKVAAVFIFIASFTWIILSKNNSSDGPELAVVQQDQTTANPVDSEAYKITTETVIQDKFEADPAVKDVNSGNTIKGKAKDKLSDNAGLAAVEQEETPASVASIAAPAMKVVDENKKADSIEVVNFGLASSAKKLISKANVEVVGDAESAGSNRVIRGRVLDTEGAPVPYARINGDANGQVLASDKEGYFSLNNGANMVNVNVNALGYETTTAILTPDNPENKIILKETQNLAMMNNRSASAFKNNMEKDDPLVKEGRPISGQKLKKNIPYISLVNAIPLAGFVKYNEQVKNMLDQESKPLLKGAVTLSFLIDSAGRATNIKILKSLQPVADSTAVKILQNAMPLKPVSKNKLSTATIKFE